MAWAGTGPTRIPGLQQREDHAHKHARRPSARSYANSPCSQTFRDRMTCQPFSAAPRSIKMALLLRRSRMMPQPATRSNRRACEAPRSCTTPHGRMSFRYRVVVRFPFDSGCADQSRDRRDVPQGEHAARGARVPAQADLAQNAAGPAALDPGRAATDGADRQYYVPEPRGMVSPGEVIEAA